MFASVLNSYVISTYSPKGFETLNPDFVDYLRTSADVTPAKYPLVINIIGDCLSEEEKRTIQRTILDESSYQLVIVEKENKRHLNTFFLMILGLVVSGVVLSATKILDEVPRELIFILFWFMGDTLCDYIF